MDEILETGTIDNDVQVDTQETIPENFEHNEVEETQEKVFTTDDIEFADNYKMSGYDLNKYKDYLTDDSLRYLEPLAQEYADKGFTQEQIEFLIDKEIEENSKPIDKETITKELNRDLTQAEKRNYRYIGTQLKRDLESANLGKYYEQLMSNSIAVKVLNAIYSKGLDIGAKTEINTRSGGNLTGTQAVNLFNEYLNKNLGNANKEEKIKELMGKLATDKDKKYFKEILQI